MIAERQRQADAKTFAEHAGHYGCEYELFKLLLPRIRLTNDDTVTVHDAPTPFEAPFVPSTPRRYFVERIQVPGYEFEAAFIPETMEVVVRDRNDTADDVIAAVALLVAAGYAELTWLACRMSQTATQRTIVRLEEMLAQARANAALYRDRAGDEAERAINAEMQMFRTKGSAAGSIARALRAAVAPRGAER